MLDVKELHVIAGKGGDGAISFAHGLRGQDGGPDGGDGGRGGDVEIVVEKDRWDLGYLYRRFRVEAGNGGNGSRGTSTGRHGQSVVLGVPLGTVAWSFPGGAEDGEARVIGEVLRPGERLVVARGGEGGRGNRAFASPTNQVPVLAEAGEAGEERVVRLEVRLLADVAIVGAPNAGKSSLLAAVTRARPRIGDFPFSTLEPVAGVAEASNRRLVLLDVPGILEGAREGRGLGLEFLRHSRRARALVQVIDGSSEDFVEEFRRVDEELRSYGAEVAAKPRVTVVNKADLDGVRERWAAQRVALERTAPGGRVRLVSAATGLGLRELLAELAELLPEEEPLPEAVIEPGVSAAGGPPPEGSAERVAVSRDGAAFVVQCRRAERILAKANLDDWRARMQFHAELERLGVLKVLEKAGVTTGDTVRIGTRELEWG